MDIDEVIEFCRRRRHLPKELTHRTIREFGVFLKEMVRYLVFDEVSEDPWLHDFQEQIAREDWDPEAFSTYVTLFHRFWKSKENEAEKQITKESECIENLLKEEEKETRDEPR